MELYAYRCTQCGKLHHPKPRVCQCGGRVFTPEPLGGPCTLLTWTRVSSLPLGYQEPYRNYGIVRFPNGLTVTGVLGFDDIETGMPLTAAVDVVRSTGPEPQYGFVFQKRQT